MYRAQLFKAKTQNIPPLLKPWLLGQGSLTQQLTDAAHGHFQVELLHECYQSMQHKDAQWMNMPLRHLAWVREVNLYGCEEKPWVKAKSIFPILSLKKQARIFPHIGRHPIGHYLFQRTTPQCERRVLLLPEGWTRQSYYLWHGCSFIVQETFLPSFIDFLETELK